MNCLFPPLDIIDAADTEQDVNAMTELFGLIWTKSSS